jgi:hypothetical protein
VFPTPTSPIVLVNRLLSSLINSTITINSDGPIMPSEASGKTPNLGPSLRKHERRNETQAYAQRCEYPNLVYFDFVEFYGTEFSIQQTQTYEWLQFLQEQTHRGWPWCDDGGMNLIPDPQGASFLTNPVNPTTVIGKVQFVAEP